MRYAPILAALVLAGLAADEAAAYYAAPLGRWVTRDPIGYEGGTYNMYEYVESRSTQRLDPTGTTSCADFLRDWEREANKRRGKGPTKDSGQHCYAACKFRECGGIVGGAGAALAGDVGEALSPSRDWPDDIAMNHYGACAPFFPIPSPVDVLFDWFLPEPTDPCDIWCGTQ